MGAGHQNIDGLILGQEGFEKVAKSGLLHGGAAGGDGVIFTAEMKKDGAAGAGFDVGVGVMADEEF
jgi:hypothetical protein